MLFDELRRRKVFRTAAAYLAAAFVVLQAADLTFEPLGFSAGAYRAIIIVAAAGFPVALLLSWFYDIRSTDDGVPRTYRSIPTYVVVAGVILLTGAFSYYAITRYKRADYGTSATLAVMPFQVIGDPQLAYLGEGIVEMLSRNIDGAANLRTIPPEMTISAAKKKKTIDARYIVTGNIAHAGNQVRITASIVDSKRGKPITREVSGTPDNLFDVVDQLSAQILAATRSGADAHLSESAALTTKSLPALRAYLEGEVHYRKTEYDSAITHYSQAVALDSTFALAYYRLSVSQWQNNRPFAAREPLTHAVRFSDRLSERDRALVLAYAAVFDGRWDDALTQYRTLLDRNPDDLEVTYSLAQAISYHNTANGKPFSESKPMLDRVAAADPEFLCPI